MTEEVQEPEVETQEVNPIEDLINNITSGELNKAEGSFQSIIQDKMEDAIAAQRVAVAKTIFNTPEGLDDEEEIVDETIEDEDDEITGDTEDETAELGGEGEDGLVADIEASAEEDEIEISDEEIEDAIETVFQEDEEILAELDDEVIEEDEIEAVE
jgi:hypothetical protein